ncbi:MAG: carboxypeptidase regulatory-like domain-containing protein [Acidobacteria bacterium]|nr:carboxypeptidase regulatory-like domain-containing protein [Acidobacteriota bacterium]
MRSHLHLMRWAPLGFLGVAVAYPAAAQSDIPRLSLLRTVAVTSGDEGGSARPEVVATDSRAFVVYLGHISPGNSRTFEVKIYDAGLDSVLAAKTLVWSSTEYGGPTDIRIASEGQNLYAFYETHKPTSSSSGITYLWGAKYALDDDFARMAGSSTPLATSRSMAELQDGDELLDDPAPLVGPGSLYVITRLKYSLSTSGRTVYRVRALSKDDLSVIGTFDLDLSEVADGRARVASLLFDGERILIALATTVSDHAVSEGNDDGAPSDIILVRLTQSWTYDPDRDVVTISAEPDDRENYVAGLKTDGRYFYAAYKQAVGLPPTGEQRAWIKMFDANFELVHAEEVRSTVWGPGGGEVRPSLEVLRSRVFSGQSTGQDLGAGDAGIWLYEIEDSGRVYGTVADKRGAPVSAARIKLAGGGNTWKTSSSCKGAYSLESIPAGSYTLRAKKRGIGSAKQKVTVASASTHVELVLE